MRLSQPPAKMSTSKNSPKASSSLCCSNTLMPDRAFIAPTRSAKRPLPIGSVSATSSSSSAMLSLSLRSSNSPHPISKDVGRIFNTKNSRRTRCTPHGSRRALSCSFSPRLPQMIGMELRHNLRFSRDRSVVRVNSAFAAKPHYEITGNVVAIADRDTLTLLDGSNEQHTFSHPLDPRGGNARLVSAIKFRNHLPLKQVVPRQTPA